MLTANIHDLTEQFPRTGQLLWIGIRPARKQSLLAVAEVVVDREFGLAGDHYAGRSKKRQITLFQFEHLSVIESFLGNPVAPEMLRRNLLIKGINLLALKNLRFQIGEAVFQATGQCHPCSRMETALGCGAYNALRQHGGITAQVIRSGRIKTGDAVRVLLEREDIEVVPDEG